LKDKKFLQKCVQKDLMLVFQNLIEKYPIIFQKDFQNNLEDIFIEAVRVGSQKIAAFLLKEKEIDPRGFTNYAGVYFALFHSKNRKQIGGLVVQKLYDMGYDLWSLQDIQLFLRSSKRDLDLKIFIRELIIIQFANSLDERALITQDRIKVIYRSTNLLLPIITEIILSYTSPIVTIEEALAVINKFKDNHYNQKRSVTRMNPYPIRDARRRPFTKINLYAMMYFINEFRTAKIKEQESRGQAAG
jgi:hypothetical protein